MCGTCGCADSTNKVTMTDLSDGSVSVMRQGGLHHQHGQNHHHSHAHEGDDQPHIHGPNGEIIALEAAILSENDKLAAQNRGWFEGRGVTVFNLVSSPGAGKTTLLERTIKELKNRITISVIEGDQMTANDASRIREAGADAIQINTGAGCHLEADMVGEAAKKLNPSSGSILMIENVGNLVCPAMFDLGEKMKIVVISTTEGEDKPIKYPHMFRSAELVLINKVDLSPYVEFDQKTCISNIQTVNPNTRVIVLSAKDGTGFSEWLDYLQGEATQNA